MKSAKDYLDEANSLVPRISAEDAMEHYGTPNTVFVDVRDSASIRQSGTIQGALEIPRGMIEFVADPATDFHNPLLAKNANIMLVCGAGGQAALAGKTLKDMGFASVTNIGGFGDWQAAGGATQGVPEK